LSAPQALPAQFGTQQVPPRQTWLPAQAGVQVQESTHVPLRQICPFVQVTLAHGLMTQLPPTHDWPLGHCTVAQGLGATQNKSQVVPAGQVASQALMSWQRPSLLEQYWPCGHITPLHGTWKQPGMQRPSTHVWLSGQFTPAQGLLVGTQPAWHMVPVGHSVELMQGSALQVPPRQIWPVGHGMPEPQADPPSPLLAASLPELASIPMPAASGLPLPIPSSKPSSQPAISKAAAARARSTRTRAHVMGGERGQATCQAARLALLALTASTYWTFGFLGGGG
jgi:hypothetical protein